MKPNIRLHQSGSLALTPHLLQSIRLLQLTAQELEQEVELALENNALLELDDEATASPDDLAADVHVGDAEAVELEAASSQEAAVSGCDESALERVEADFDWSSAESPGSGEPVEGGESLEARCPAAVIEDARISALHQLELIISEPSVHRLAVALIEHVDDNGYLECGLTEILDGLPPEWGTTLAELEAALVTVQGVEPTGFAARDLRECLLLQLEALPAGISGRNLAERLVADYLPRIAARDFHALRRELDASEEKFIHAMNLIRSLDPKPGASRIEPAQAVVPDLLVTGSEGSWKVELNPAQLPRLRINAHYQKLLSQGVNHRGMNDQLQQARWLVRGLQMRHETLLKTAQVIFKRQSGFLRMGEEGMLPLTLREVAEVIAMHESTVCRVTSNKFVQTPWGVYALKDFFPSTITRADTDVPETSGIAVRAMIRHIVESERADAPLCDGDIAAILRRKGVVLVRRTVAKYREAMRIAPVKARVREQKLGNRHAFYAASMSAAIPA